MKRVLAIVVLGICASACSGSSSTTTATPTASPTPTKIITVSGNLAFGNVVIGSSADRTFTIGNSGNAALTFTSFSCAGGTGAVGYSANPTSGTVGAGTSVTSTVHFAPTLAQFYSCVLSVVGDQTSGGAAINVSGTGIVSTPAAPSTYLVKGTLKDGTSNGILPNITVQIVAGTNVGKSAVTDSSGNYSMDSLSAGTFTLSAAAVSYLTTTQQVTLPPSQTVPLVLQRASTPPPISPIPSSCTEGPYTWDANPNVLRCRNRLGQFAPSVCCGR